MLSLSQTAGYAIMALSHLDPEGDSLVQEKEIAAKTGISKPYLSKLIYKLGKAGLLLSKRGNKGGIALARPAASITMLDIAEAVDGEDWRKRCLLGLPICGNDNPCPLHEYWAKQRPKLEEKLASLTLTQVIKFQERGWRL